ncbi:DUF6879 family protein [Streptomyces xanthochromogenes]|uniref:DUF6879 family protein n=1 Tax=Streptomyces xanthochromogenes TaxID=67384 RepID=UPI00343D49D0
MTLRYIGTTSDDGDCPTLYEVEGTGDILVQGERVTDPEHLVRLRDVKESETFVTVPRELLARFAPRAVPNDPIPFSEMTHMFADFQHTAWRLETRRGYASDRKGEKWQRWQAGEGIADEPFDAWRTNVRKQTDQGKRFERVRLFDSRTLVRFVFDDEDNTLGVIVSEDPPEVLAACQARDKAWHYATRTEEFQRQVRSSV